MKPTTKFREILNRNRISVAVAAHDPLLAKLVEKAGFEIVTVSGNAVAASYLGMPDMGFVNLSDIVDVSRRIAAAVEIPVYVDADNGYGNAVQVFRTVNELERAGVAGIMLEDQIDYKKCSMMEGAHPVVSAEEHAAKIRAACRAKTDPDFLIVARTDSAADHGLDEAIRRARMYYEAGADGVNIQMKGTAEEVARITEANLNIPLFGTMDEGKELWKQDFATLEAAGVRIASYPGVVRYTVVKSVQEALAHLKREGSTEAIRDKMATTQEYFAAVDIDKYIQLEKEVLP